MKVKDLVFAEHPRQSRFKDLTGQKFNRLFVLGLQGIVKKSAVWWCRCDCGATTTARSYQMKVGEKQSCGCLAREVRTKCRRIHGMYKTRVFRIWAGILARCNNPNDTAYPRYGGRGIKVCDRWSEFANFYADMGDPPTDKYSLDRMDNEGSYAPDNCRWATWQTQMNNTSRNRYLTRDGKTKTLTEWSRHIGLSVATIYARIKKGLPIEQVLSSERFKTGPKHSTVFEFRRSKADAEV